MYSPTNATAAKVRALSLLKFPNIDKFRREIPLPSILAYTMDLGPIDSRSDKNMYGKNVIIDSESIPLIGSADHVDDICDSDDNNVTLSLSMVTGNDIDADNKSKDIHKGCTDSGENNNNNMNISIDNSNYTSNNDNSISMTTGMTITGEIKSETKSENENSVQHSSDSVTVLATTSTSTSNCTSSAISMSLSNADKEYVDDQCFSLPCSEIASHKGKHHLTVNFHPSRIYFSTSYVYFSTSCAYFSTSYVYFSTSSLLFSF